MTYVSLTAVIPSWIRRSITTSTSGLPQGWQDDGTTLKAPNGHTVVKGFRDHILKAAWASWDVPLQEEEGRSQVEESNSQLGNGTRQIFNAHLLEWTKARGVFEGYIGQELLYVLQDRAKAPADLKQAQSDVASLQKQIEDLKAQLAGTKQAPTPTPAAQKA